SSGTLKVKLTDNANGVVVADAVRIVRRGVDNRIVSGGGSTFAYDLEGNRTSATDGSNNVTTFADDHRNRLLGITTKNSGGSITKMATYTFDAQDRRIGAKVDSDGAGGTAAVQTWMVYDGVNTYADFDNAGTLSTRYLYGPAVDEIL